MLYTQRIFWPRFNTKEKLDELLTFLKKHRPLSKEISFFTEGDGNDWRYLPPDEVEKRAKYLAEAVSLVREQGFIPVINILNTMAHSDEGGPEAPVVPWQGIVDINGAQARQCSCPADEQFLDYVRFKYETFAKCGAVRYWIDDDVRMHNHQPVNTACFCPACLADFSKIAGKTFDRETLARELRSDRKLRDLWMARTGRVMLDVLRACAEGVRRSQPGAEIGFMLGDVVHHLDGGVDLSLWMTELGKIVGGQAWIRPGGGFWGDDCMRNVLSKIHGTSNSIAHLPSGVKSTYEVENYPFTLGTKSATGTGMECLMVILASRLEGIMFDIFGVDLKANERWVSDLEKWLPLWDKASALVSGTLPHGWQPVYSPRHFQQHVEERDVSKLFSPEYQKSLELQKAGVPLTAFADEACGHLLNGEAALGMSEKELRDLLNQPLIMDAEAAKRYLDLGLGAEIGLRGLSVRPEGAYEVFTDHPINGETAGYNRVATMKYFGLVSYALDPLPATMSLSSLVNNYGQLLGSALTLHQAAGRPGVAVMGHMPWTHVLSPQRMTQLRYLAKAMAAEPTPFIELCDRAVPFWYRRGDGKQLAVLFNPGLDEVTVKLGNVASLALDLATPGVELKAKTEVYLPSWAIAVLKIENA